MRLDTKGALHRLVNTALTKSLEASRQILIFAAIVVTKKIYQRLSRRRLFTYP